MLGILTGLAGVMASTLFITCCEPRRKRGGYQPKVPKGSRPTPPTGGPEKGRAGMNGE